MGLCSTTVHCSFLGPFRSQQIKGGGFKGIVHQRTIFSLVHKCITPMYSFFLFIIYGRNLPNFRARRRIQIRNVTLYLDLIKRTCLIDLFENNQFIVQNFNITIRSTYNYHLQYRWLLGFYIVFFKYQLTFFSARWHLSPGCTGPAQAMVNNSGFSQIKTNMKSVTIYKVMDIKCGKYF